MKMLLGAEIGALVCGLVVLVTGKFKVTSAQSVTGWQARLCGLMCVLLIPFVFVTGGVYGAILVVNGVPVDTFDQYGWHFIVIEAVSIVVWLLGIWLLGKTFLSQQTHRQRRRQR